MITQKATEVAIRSLINHPSLFTHEQFDQTGALIFVLFEIRDEMARLTEAVKDLKGK